MENWEIWFHAWPSLSKVAVDKFLLFLACHSVVRTGVLNAHACYHALTCLHSSRSAWDQAGS